MKKFLPVLFCLIFLGSLSAQKKGSLAVEPKKEQLKSIANGYLTPLSPEKSAEFEAEEKARKKAVKKKEQQKQKKVLKKPQKHKRKTIIRKRAKTKPQ